MGSLIGNEGELFVPSGNEVGLWYGLLGGTCEHEYEIDAAEELEQELKFKWIPAPPPGYKRQYTTLHTEGPLTPNLPEYRIPGDNLNNYMDYRIYYASSDVQPIDDDTRCVSNDIEIPFYLDQYDKFIYDFDSIYQLTFTDCLVVGVEGGTNESYIQHNKSIHVRAFKHLLHLIVGLFFIPFYSIGQNGFRIDINSRLDEYPACFIQDSNDDFVGIIWKSVVPYFERQTYIYKISPEGDTSSYLFDLQDTILNLNTIIQVNALPIEYGIIFAFTISFSIFNLKMRLFTPFKVYSN